MYTCLGFFPPINKVSTTVSKEIYEKRKNEMIGQGWKIVEEKKKRYKRVKIIATRRFTI